jgi:uncharacterized protein (DUF433 family)
MTPTAYPHIVLKESGTPMIEGTRISVARIALDHTLHKISVDDIPAQYGGLTLAEVCAALVYYYDHKEEMDRNIAETKREIAARREAARTTNADLRAKLRSRSS